MKTILNRPGLNALCVALLVAASALYARPATDDKKSENSEVPRIKRTYEWKAVPGAKLYAIEIKDKNGKLLISRRLPINRIELELPEGEYLHRITVLNKFRKPTGWTPWTPLRLGVARSPSVQKVLPAKLVIPQDSPPGKKVLRKIEIKGNNFVKSTKVKLLTKDGPIPLENVIIKDNNTIVVEADIAGLTSGKFDLVIENPRNKILREKHKVTVVREEDLPGPRRVVGRIRKDPNSPGTPGKTDKDNRVPSKTTLFIPGVDQFRRGETGAGIFWSGLFASYGAAAFYEYNKAQSALNEANAPLTNLFATPYSAFFLPDFASNTGNTTTFLGLGVYSLLERDRLKNEYNTHVRNQSYIGGAAVLSYLFYIYRESDTNWSAANLVPGLPDYKNDHKFRGALWFTTFAGLLGGAIAEYSAAQNSLNAAGANPFIQLYNNPFLYFSSVSSLQSSLGNSTTIWLGVQAFSDNQVANVNYDAHVRNQRLFLGGATFVYIAHMIYAGKLSAPSSSSSKKSAGAIPQSYMDILTFQGNDKNDRITQLRYNIRF